ncbi:MAG: TIGR03086 family metal-binding protein [Actinomycetota bacterium]
MAGEADRFRTIAAGFTERVENVPEGGWEMEAPCEGWVARDVVRHLAEWVPWFMQEGTGRELAPLPSVDDDPVGAWAGLRDQLQERLDEPDAGAQMFSSEMFGGDIPFPVAVERFVTSDVIVHTWDLARACGLDETIDAEFARNMYEGMQPIAEMLVQSGHYKPAVEVPDDADDQTRLIAFTGRQP